MGVKIKTPDMQKEESLYIKFVPIPPVYQSPDSRRAMEIYDSLIFQIVSDSELPTCLHETPPSVQDRLYNGWKMS